MNRKPLSEHVLAAQWHPTRNSVGLDTVGVSSSLTVWWLGECGHEWEAKIKSRVGRFSGCPYCVGQKTLAGFNDLGTTHPALAAEWHLTRNGGLSFSQVSAGSNRKVWWLGACGHEWETMVANRVKGQGCPVCVGQKTLVGVNDLATTHPALAAEWHLTRNGGLSFSQVSAGSNRKVWWLGACGHEWEATVVHRSAGRGCPVCVGKQTLVGVNDLATTHPGKLGSWDYERNVLTPQEVTAGSHTKVWWVCGGGHSWETSVANRVLNNGGGTECPNCLTVSRGQQEVENYIRSILGGVPVVVGDRSVLGGKELDVYIPSKRVAVEYNGVFWHSEAAGKGRKYHYDKWKACKEQGIQLIQVWEDDWGRNPGLVKRMLAHKLGVSSEEKLFARKTIVVELKRGVVEPFLVENHLQGYRIAKYFGLIPKGGSIENPVAVLGVARKGDTLEVIRFATVGRVVGGFSKLLKHVLGLGAYGGVAQVVSYSHNDHSDGGVYVANGFELVHEGSPGYSYWRNGWSGRQNRLKYSPSRVKANPNLVFEAGAGERRLAVLNNLVRVWDSGSTLWVKKI